MLFRSKGVKIGVTTQIRVTHLSIGMTNESWEKNRKIFAERHQEYLPSKIKFSENDKIKVLISCLFFQNYTGSEMYVFELAKNLKQMNCDVTIVANGTNGPLVKLANNLGISVKNINEPPGYKLGDGKWIVNTVNGTRKSELGVYYKIGEVHFDIIHCQHKPITELMCKLYPTIDKISTIHSEIIHLENPIKNTSIKKYIAIRPEIKNHMVSKFDIKENEVQVIYNPINSEKFNTVNTKNDGYTLFVGTIDNIRKNTIFDLVNYTKEKNKELWVVGKNHSDYLQDLKSNSHVKYFDSTPDVEKFVKNCDETAGILLGRTTIEGWMCGKPGWIYDVDPNGNIKSKTKHEVPSDIDKFDSKLVSKQIKEEYLKILNS
mgnify:CR=1 FL=1